MSQNDYHIEYKLDGQYFKYDTKSGFLAEKMVSNIMSFADMNKLPLWKTYLKLHIRKKNYEQFCFTVGKLDDRILVTNVHYN
jgi:hypothetical protein